MTKEEVAKYALKRLEINQINYLEYKPTIVDGKKVEKTIVGDFIGVYNKKLNDKNLWEFRIRKSYDNEYKVINGNELKSIKTMPC